MRLVYVALAVFVAAVHCGTFLDSVVGTACQQNLIQYEYGCGPGFVCKCQSPQWLGSIMECIHSQAKSEREINRGIKFIIASCKERGLRTHTYEQMEGYYQNATSYLREPTLDDRLVPIQNPVYVNMTSFHFYMSSYSSVHSHVVLSQWLGWGLNAYWGAVIAAATLYRLTKRHINLPNWVTKYLLLKSLDQKFPILARISPIRIPNNMQVIIIFGFTVQTILSTAISYNVVTPNAYIRDPYFMLLRLMGYRTALLSFSLFPAIYFFGIRNNPFSYISGLSFADFNLYHQYISVVMAIEGLLHSAVWTVYSMKRQGYYWWVTDRYFQWGIVGTISVYLLIFQSHPLFRKWCYEFFLKVHQAFSALFIVAMWYHCISFGWMGWVYSMVAIWCFDRLCRIVRIVASGGYQNAVLKKYEGKSDVIEITLQKPRLFTYFPGCYCYINFADPWYLIWQSHPFTVIESENDLVFYIKAKKGITQSLAKRLEQNGSLETKIILEGPYGEPLEKRDTKTVGIAGGLGITSVYQDLASCTTTPLYVSRDTADSSEESLGKKQSTEKDGTLCFNKLYWVVNDVTEVEWFGEKIRHLIKLGCEVEVLVTDPAQVSLEEYVTILGGRPDVKGLVMAEVSAAEESGHDVDFVVCGPISLSNDVKHQVSICMPKGNSNSRVGYHERNMER